MSVIPNDKPASPDDLIAPSADAAVELTEDALDNAAGGASLKYDAAAVKTNVDPLKLNAADQWKLSTPITSAGDGSVKLV